MKIETAQHLHWFALKVFGNKVFQYESLLGTLDIETYIPCEQVMVERNGVKKNFRRPVVASLLFFRATQRQALDFQKQHQGAIALYMYQRDYKKEPLVIPDREMNIFMLVSSRGTEGMECIDPSRVKLNLNDRVRVTDGFFKGAEGYICRIKGNRRLIVAIKGVCMVATSYIPQAFLQKIES